MSLMKVKGIYQVKKISDITTLEIDNLILEVVGDIEELVLFEKTDYESCKLVIDTFHKKSCFEKEITEKLFVIGNDEQSKLLHECMNEKKIQDIFTGRNLGELVKTILSLVFYDFTNLCLTHDANEGSQISCYYLANIHGNNLPYEREFLPITLNEIKTGIFAKELSLRGGKLHNELFAKQLLEITKAYSYLTK
jgi:hypothetical protein